MSQQAVPEEQPGGQQRIKVLLVDDIQENLELLEDVLAEYGYATIAVRNGREALECLKSEQVHLIVADGMMPKVDGFQLCKQVKQNPAYAKLPFVIYTANYIEREDEELARSIGVDKYVVKHAGVASLVEAVNELSHQRYGYRSDEVSEPPQFIDDTAFLEKHHAILIRKLEEKMVELEMYAETLARKNRELEVSESRYRNLFEKASVAIFVMDQDGVRISDVNRQGLKLLGYTREELLEMPGLPYSENGAFRTHTMKWKEYVLGEVTLKAKGGTSVDVEVVAGSVAGSGDERILLYVRDISQERRMRQHLQQAEKMMLMGRLASGIAHEIRNPLAAVSLNLQYLRTICNVSQAEGEVVDAALEGAKRIDQVVQNTLYLARLTPLHRQQEQLNDVVERSLWFLKIPLQQKDLSIETHYGEDLPPVMVDAKQVQQVLLNLLQNAIEASPQKGRISIATGLEATEGASSGESKVFVTIADSGDGMPQEIAQHMFEPFCTTKMGGTGLGLTISKYIMDRHDGEIHVQPATPNGTVIRLSFPSHNI